MKELVNPRTEEVDLEARRISLSARDANLGGPIPHCWRTCFAEYLDELRPSLPKSATCSPTPGATGASAVATGLGRLHDLVLEAGICGCGRSLFLTGGATVMPRASSAGARTSTSSRD